MQESNSRSHLARLPVNCYRGPSSFVHWTMTTDRRETGWLDARHHSQLREQLLHSLIRYRLVCPIYALMPDHGHFLLMGYHEASDQKAAVRYFRRQWNLLLRPRFELQHQAYDHVLDEQERKRDAFEKVAHYIARNPVRANLVKTASDYPYSGSIFPGFAQMDPRNQRFWTTFWIEYNKLVESG